MAERRKLAAAFTRQIGPGISDKRRGPYPFFVTGPSVSFAWTPKFGFLQDGKTVVRGGYQVSYDRWFNNLFSNMAAGTPNNPSNFPVNATGGGRGLSGLYAVRFPAIVNGGVSTATDTSSQFTPNIRNPYTERWSFGIQRELPMKMIVDVSYVGSASRKLYQSQQLNPNANPVYNSTTGAYSLGPRLIPAIGARQVRAAAANSNYNSMQVEVRKRAGNTPIGQLQFSSAWTWGKTMSVIDEVFATNNSNYTLMTANPLLYGGNRNWDYSVSDMDRRHRWVSAMVWDLRGPKTGILGQVLGGWSISTVGPVHSGAPITVINGIDRDLDGANADRPDIGNPRAPLNTMAQRISTATCTTGWQSVIGTCVNPGDVHWLYYPTGSYSKTNANTAHRNSVLTQTGRIIPDLNILKKFKVRESVGLEYRAEIFNFVNHRNFDFVPLNTSLSGIFNSRDAVTGLPTTSFLDATQDNAGNRSMCMQLKLIF